ncbi:MAG: DUF721 domain-containing protein [Flavobacteriales bacterium]|nr:DUF721 domain-containing protein [Flavobacteriales bacterium]
MKRSNDNTIKELLERYVKTFKLKNKLTEVELVNSWESIVGAPIAKHTTKIYLSGPRLYVHIDSSVIRQELSYAKAKLIESLNEKAGYEAVGEIILR